MILLLALAAAQICVLPGLLVSRLVFRGVGPGVVPELAFVFGASLVVNYLFAFGLAAVHAWSAGAVAGMIVIELAGLWATGFFRGVSGRVVAAARRMVAVAVAFIRPAPTFMFWTRIVLLGIALRALAMLVSRAVGMQGSIFEGWDAVVSWNRWAGDFMANRLPELTWHYPQLLPANWSVSYHLLGEPLQFVARGVMPVFLVALVAHLVWLGVTQRSTAFLAAAALVPVMRKYTWTDGYADVPVAVLSCEALLWILMAKRERDGARAGRLIFAATLFAAGAAVTKQAGLFVFFLLPVLTALLDPRTAGRRRFWLGWVLTGLVVVAPFYARVEWLIHQGVMTSEVPYVTGGIFRGAGLWERFGHACEAVVGLPGSWAALGLALAAWLAGLRNRDVRVVAAVIVVPYFLIWAFFFSYDLRNAALLVPFFCLGAGAGIETLATEIARQFDGGGWSAFVGRLPGRMPRVLAFTAAAAAIALLVAGIGGGRRWTREGLQARQDRLLRRIGSPELNERLYAHAGAAGVAGVILTDYQPLRFLPGLKEHALIAQVLQQEGPEGLRAFREVLAAHSVSHLLIPDTTGRATVAYIGAGVRSGRFREVPGFEHTGYRFFAVRRGAR